ncbi:MAG: hypothetical protein HOH38_04480 [Nitrospinaceae bacterium]|nr:hypothetical protein [Nitrospina sp.]MBT5868076.1 hypothetical protein [Nitrospinaceae bacterium]MBT6347227.1 hypothetical protein [Nitrospina sp.]
MSGIKEDLVCEIIRLSQTNLLDRKCANMSAETQDQVAVDWIQKNAAKYRVDFQSRLEVYSASQLSEILKELTVSEKDLNDILKVI